MGWTLFLEFRDAAQNWLFEHSTDNVCSATGWNGHYQGRAETKGNLVRTLHGRCDDNGTSNDECVYDLRKKSGAYVDLGKMDALQGTRRDQ